ncbi:MULTISPECIES: energy-coupling factor ABC transporter substrate-binding protein [Dehalobacter]|jgi:cobalt/nickel transport protein|uniref:Cobalt transport protein CbiN n=2 Tax=Dehalobacter restrictus TaxID=55583 RepID=A0A857DF18_9FIRM|nr:MULTISPECIES: energy-coupling factor ABC transporter substrate-binding protein [Dehalobacter]AHF08946.1 cobalt transporter CbiN [Dehalobacter restrictus DSM 9455]MCG1025542.1 energy-coupling factor ABC transporter substrate-binding protein [Dehalobacter sp.]OCZ51898.1 cobalt ABC transporter substrate-binding protein CbiN [Dehalobacter sp. TeCB1]QGZ99466.1 energy-coupling factor ABC transporter substrate-binding protein [Dehalobacter restrictus]
MNNTYDKQGNKKRITTNLILIVIVILLAVIPLIIAKDAEFGGADGQAETAITEINPEYNPWFSSIFEPPSGEIESLLFALQAALGSGILFYGLGYLKGRSKKEENRNKA